MKKEISEKRNRKAKQQKRNERDQRIEKFKGVGKIKLIKGRNLPTREGRDEWENFGASEKSRILQKKRKVWKTPTKARELGGRRRSRKENSKKKLREFERIEESRRNSIELQGTMERKEWNKPEEGRER